MYFTQELIEQIAKALQERGVKDSDFASAQSLTGDELIALVQDNVNVNTSLKDLAKVILPLVVYNEGEVPVIDSLESDNTNAALSANQGKVLKGLIDALMENLPEQGEASETQVTLTSDFNLGGIKKGRVFEHAPISEVLKELLVEEYAPRWEDATFSIILPVNIQQVMSVGDKIPSSNVLNYSNTPAQAITTVNNQEYIAQNVFSRHFNPTLDELDFNQTVTDRKEVTISCKAEFNKGTKPVVSSKGHTTTKTASDNVTPLAEAVENPNINEDGTIKNTEAIAEVKLQYTYPIFVNGAKLPLDYDKDCYGEDKDLTYVVSKDRPLDIQIPASYTSFTLYYWDYLAHDWIELSVENNAKTIEIGSTNKSVTYTQYLFTEITGERPYKFTFEIH